MSSPSSHTPTVSLTIPVDMFEKDNILSDKLNDFQTRYSRFVRCQDDAVASSVNPSCTANDSFVNVQKSYVSLLSTIQDISNSLVNQALLGTNPEESNEDQDDIMGTYAEIRKQRKHLDEVLDRLYREQKGSSESSEYQLKQSMYANTLWIILASCFIWYAVVEM